MTDNGFFVTVEGIDGAGKTTVVDAINAEWKQVLLTQEPSELWTGKQVRRAISNESDTHPLATFYLFMADRIHHIEEEIRPALDRGMLVVSDRYADSTLAYQPIALDEHVEEPRSFMDATMEPWNFDPDLTIYIDVPIEVAMQRLDGDEEYEKREFLRGVKENYEAIRDGNSDRFVTIDGTQSKEAVREEALDIIRGYYE